ncbi:MAG: hypothetical protein A3I07_03660 [Candidatus Doudnabacteria bacterium RIFCSPLOWO2_02_FULL_42_9]|uniref:Uncharacterized protein n=1 Tax=Candidatus Doudnabacteria bacterium RIFCSPHIGHO2_01_FULL_41_86 TaxID=1817821 RepID=A0A1F5N9X3_9BACT|nr:MAG: hypothetical protein A2717_02370 [Candidatus Doudnabacteria bacterium RIFCSPHIGHO2_01_FULL_41_86]OGE75606.1 MAG: hypothetical protein A3K07_02130 [Candidatus Doudnabacteria bacterium RIFCSPHIGHO2_01_43_10]OGE85401.1 MAG: hypothetical protein A3E28_01940 [Candidatus Doudnabacteria bacterium RIFCSPHIGHO2_12_FULL_42_22]OGE86939.1 MAG: hypothetical protein A3C49_02775 [Candidatus Doudnabacteria bacterium RIFCSPHIGHO2_02_FULL_42_25]OGE92538.1 MAG: hypothetical protein A2895_02930 [Candidatus
MRYSNDWWNDESVYAWNCVTKRQIHVSGHKAAEAEIKKQKYPQNWRIIGLDTCSNCGGSWDGNRDCANYCMDVYRGREDPNPEMTDLGESTSWGDVFSKAIDLYCDEKIDMIATVSQQDFLKQQWFAPVITSLEYLHSLRELAPDVYPEDERFHLLLGDMILEPSQLRKVRTQLVVVRLKPGEIFRMPVTEPKEASGQGTDQAN